MAFRRFVAAGRYSLTESRLFEVRDMAGALVRAT
jgi:hypothetical protein